MSMKFSKLSVFWGDTPSSTWSGAFAAVSSEGLTSWEGQARAWSEVELRISCGCVAEDGDSGDECCRLGPLGRLRSRPAARASWFDSGAMELAERLSIGEAMGLDDRLSEGETGMSLL